MLPRLWRVPAARKQDTDSEMSLQPHVARLNPCGNMWGKPPGAKGSVLMGLEVLVICHLSCAFALSQTPWENELWRTL